MAITSNPKIYSRTEWNARPIDYENLTLLSGVSKKYILVHHTAGLTDRGEFSDGEKMRAIQQAHLNSLYGDIGYNFMVGYYGSIMEGRSLDFVGAHCNTNSKNYDSIGVCVSGNFELITQSLTNDAKDSLISSLIYLCNKYNISPNNIKGHKDYGPTDCPGKSLYQQLPSIISTVSKYVTNSNTEKVNVTYQIYTGGSWLPNVTNLDDYAGIYGHPVQCIYANTDKGSIRYRVHVNGGNWLSWVVQRTDYAGIYGQNIDGLQMELLNNPGKNVRKLIHLALS
ncbi:MAG: peptidoglycan recognition family protein [Clostridium sp.]